MESRSSYGYYGSAGGYTGEAKPKKTHESGYCFHRYLVEVREDTGRCCLMITARSRENAIKQIEKLVRETNSQKNLAEINPWKRMSVIHEVFWDTLKVH